LVYFVHQRKDWKERDRHRQGRCYSNKAQQASTDSYAFRVVNDRSPMRGRTEEREKVTCQVYWPGSWEGTDENLSLLMLFSWLFPPYLCSPQDWDPLNLRPLG
jgi:hypothetical protein